MGVARAPIIPRGEKTTGGDLRCRKIYTRDGKGVEGQARTRRGQSPNEQISETTRSENKNTDGYVAQLRAVWKRGKKKKKNNKKIHILIQKSYMMCCGTKMFFTAFFICDLTRPTTGPPNAVGI